MTDSLQTLLEALVSQEFLVGLAAGLLSLGALAVLIAKPHLRPWGAAVAIAFVVGAWLVIDRRLMLAASVALIMCGGWAVARSGSGRAGVVPNSFLQVGGGLLLLAGIFVLLTRSGLPSATWIRVLLGAGLLVYGFALRWWDTSKRITLLGLLFLITVFGIWVTVPDTEEARVLLGTAAALAVATAAPVGARVSLAGGLGVGAVVAWTVGMGGLGRGSSMFGAMGAIGVILILPLLDRLGRSLDHLPSWAVVVIHAGIVVVTTRVFGILQATTPAAVGVATTLAIATAVLYPIARPIEEQVPAE